MYSGTAAIAYVLKRIETVLSSLSPIQTEISNARGGKENIDERFDDIETTYVRTVDNHDVPSGGTTGQVLKKTSNENYALGWAADEGGSGSGDVIGPSSSVDGNIVLFDGITGKLIKDSGKILSLITLKNLLSNGAFDLSTTGWTTTTATVSVVNGIVNITATAPGGCINQQVTEIPPGMVMYGRCIAQPAYAASTFFNFVTQTSGGTTIADHAPAVDDITQMKKYSIRFTTEATTAKITCYLVDWKASPWGANKWDNIVLLNLTSIFGAGNEPTIEVMDAIMESLPNGYINGYASIFKP